MDGEYVHTIHTSFLCIHTKFYSDLAIDQLESPKNSQDYSDTFRFDVCIHK